MRILSVQYIAFIRIELIAGINTTEAVFFPCDF